jgi:DNA modification methylase
MPPYGPRNPHPLSILRGELVWEGKYDARGRRRTPDLPDPPPPLALAERWEPPTGSGDRAPTSPPNRLIEGDNLLALAALRDELRGQVQLIYIDPPFAANTEYLMRVPVGPGGPPDNGTGPLELLAYRDVWGPGAGSYLSMMHERLVLLRELLRDTGCLFVHCDWRSNAPLRLLLDEVFGAERFVNEIVWHYYNKYSAGRFRLPRAHDTLLVYARGPRPALNSLRLPRESPLRQLVRENVGGVLKNARDAQGRLRYRLSLERKGDDVWRIPQLQPASRHWTGYRTQKHPELLRRIVALGSRPGDLVADFFCGSGTTLAVAEAMGRHWVGCDLGRMSIHVTRRRLLLARDGAPPTEDREAPAPRPFALHSLAIETRRRWFEGTLGGSRAAYRRRVLEAFGAEVPSRPAHPALHGMRDGAFCQVCPPGRPVGLRALRALASAAREGGSAQAYCLAWEFAPGVPARLEPGKAGAVVIPVRIPPELAAPEGEALGPFRGLPWVDLALRLGRDSEGCRTVAVRLEDFRPGVVLSGASADGAPGAGHPGEGLDWLDGWSIDFAWRPGQPFTHGWWAFRGPRGRSLRQESSPRAIPEGAGARVLGVMAMDVYGSATLHALPVADRACARG